MGTVQTCVCVHKCVSLLIHMHVSWREHDFPLCHEQENSCLFQILKECALGWVFFWHQNKECLSFPLALNLFLGLFATICQIFLSLTWNWPLDKREGKQSPETLSLCSFVLGTVNRGIRWITQLGFVSWKVIRAAVRAGFMKLSGQAWAGASYTCFADVNVCSCHTAEAARSLSLNRDAARMANNR